MAMDGIVLLVGILVVMLYIKLKSIYSFKLRNCLYFCGNLDLCLTLSFICVFLSYEFGEKILGN